MPIICWKLADFAECNPSTFIFGWKLADFAECSPSTFSFMGCDCSIMLRGEFCAKTCEGNFLVHDSHMDSYACCTMVLT